MTFNIVVPASAESPGVFPAQNNTNFDRLRANINNDHNFQNTNAADQGIHRQCTMINRATPVGPLAAGNGILYSKNDVNGNAQLNWYNGNSNVEITPGVQLFEGTTLVAPAVPQTVFADPGYSYNATLWYVISGTNTISLNSAYLIQPGMGDSDIENIKGQSNVFAFNGNDIQLTNNTLANITYKWAITISRLT